MELTGAAIVQVPAVLNSQTVCDFRSTLDAALADGDSYAVVLLGEERFFCRGLDLAASAGESGFQIALESFAACLEIIRTGHKPVIALVQGEAVAGGVGLAAACDGVLATKEATFTLTELLFGLTPAVILPYLAQRVSGQKLRWMGLMAQTITAEQALEAGLVDSVCASEKAPSILQLWIRKLSRVQPGTVAAWKRMTLCAPAPGSPVGVAITLERLRDPAVQNGFLAFLKSGALPWVKDNE